MTDQQKFKITWISAGIGFALQLIALGWFASDLTNGVRDNARVIKEIKDEQASRTSRVYFIDRLSDRVDRIGKDVEEIKKILRSK